MLIGDRVTEEVLRLNMRAHGCMFMVVLFLVLLIVLYFTCGIVNSFFNDCGWFAYFVYEGLSGN